MVAFTVFTAVYNGGSTLDRVYQSLLKQSFTDFEWLIIDDGSTDDTRVVIDQMIKDSIINIKVYPQKNMHKFYSLQKGIELANGKFFLIADADDEFREDTLIKFHETFESVPINEQQDLIGVNCLCMDINGRIIGDPYPRHGMRSDHNEMIYKYKVKGEKWGMQRTEVLKKFKFTDEYFNNGCIPEGILWSKIAEAGYKIIFINEAFRIYYNEGNPESISTRSREELEKNSFGSMQMLKLVLNNHINYFWFAPFHFIKSSILYYEAARLQKLNTTQAAKGLRGIGKVLYWTSYPFSFLFFSARKNAIKIKS